MKEKTVQLLKHGDLSIKATIWESPTQKTVLLYLHGGGLVFGNRQDLPTAYIEKFNQNGITVVAVDYLLTPESKLDQLLLTLKQTINELSVSCDLSNLVIMGRSAGAYLAYLLIRDGLDVDAFIDFYGYATLSAPEFISPTPYYSQFPQVLPMTAQGIVRSHPIVFGDMNDRFPLYVSARQFGNWLSLFLPDMSQRDTYSLNENELKKFPKTLLVHCTDDPDVPVAIARRTAKLIPKATLVLVNQNTHDFDRDVTTVSLAYYDQVIAFIRQK